MHGGSRCTERDTDGGCAAQQVPGSIRAPQTAKNKTEAAEQACCSLLTSGGAHCGCRGHLEAHCLLQYPGAAGEGACRVLGADAVEQAACQGSVPCNASDDAALGQELC